MSEEKKKKIALEVAMTWAGVNYAPGINEMPAEAVDSAIKRKLGKAIGTAKDSAEESADFTPLSIEETMERFGKGDPSDQVFQSLKFHQAAIVAKRGAFEAGRSEGDDLTNKGKIEKAVEDAKSNQNAEDPNKDKTQTGLPEDFPMRHVFEKLGFTSVAAIQAKTRDELIAMDGIADKTADKALAYGK